MSLQTESCSACRADAPKVSLDEVEQLIQQIPAWHLVTIEAIAQLQREYGFKNFSEALTYTNKVGELAEAEGHHPAILTEWGKVNIRWWSHKIKGLHRNDFIMASKCDAIFASLLSPASVF